MSKRRTQVIGIDYLPVTKKPTTPKTVTIVKKEQPERKEKKRKNVKIPKEPKPKKHKDKPTEKPKQYTENTNHFFCKIGSDVRRIIFSLLDEKSFVAFISTCGQFRTFFSREKPLCCKYHIAEKLNRLKIFWFEHLEFVRGRDFFDIPKGTTKLSFSNCRSDFSLMGETSNIKEIQIKKSKSIVNITKYNVPLGLHSLSISTNYRPKDISVFNHLKELHITHLTTRNVPFFRKPFYVSPVLEKLTLPRCFSGRIYFPPESRLTHLYIQNTSYDYILDFPSSITHLMISFYSVNKRDIKYTFILPPKIEEVTIYKMNVRGCHVIIPESARLFEMYCSEQCDISFPINSRLHTLKINGNFNQKFEYLPHFIQSLQISSCYSDKLPLIPSSIKELIIGDHYNYPLEFLYSTESDLPYPNLKILVLGKGYNQPLEFQFPQGFEELIVRNLNYSHPFLFHENPSSLKTIILENMSYPYMYDSSMPVTPTIQRTYFPMSEIWKPKNELTA